jgi:hypothetical protein
MPRFMTLHHETNLDRVLLESRWTEISMDPRADWLMTLYGVDPGERFCEWEAPDRETIEQIFWELKIKFTEIIEVDVTSGTDWRLWQIESGQGRKKCWEIMRCGREPAAPVEGYPDFCPAAINVPSPERETDAHGSRYCWKVVGTRCHEMVGGMVTDRWIESHTCPYFGDIRYRSVFKPDA